MTTTPQTNASAVATGILAQHTAHLDAGTFLIQRCKACGNAIYFPREVCPHCGSGDIHFVAPGGMGTVYSTTVVRRKPEAGGDYNVCIVELDEGVRLMSRVTGVVPDVVKIGMRVQARVELTPADVQPGGQADGKTKGRVVFDAMQGAAHPAGTDTDTDTSTGTGTGTGKGTPSHFERILQAPAVQTPSPMAALRGKTAIVGVGTFGFGEAHGYTDMELLAKSAHAAVADAGLTMQDIDGLCTASTTSTMWALPVTEYLGINPKFVSGTMIGGSSFIAHLLPAIQALNSGQCNAVLVCYGSVQRTAQFGRAEVAKARKWLDPQPYETPYEPMQPLSAYALAAARHMHQYGTTRRHLAEVAVAARGWAQLNPQAFMRDPLTIDDVLKARMVSDPFSVRDCCLVTDGGGAYVLVRSDRAKDLQQKPVYVLGNATAQWHRGISAMPDLTVSAASQSGREAYAMAGLQAKDIDVVELYDAFTINTLLFLEDLGFCKKGEAGAFVEGGAIGPGGRLPVNTNGGGLSCVHPGMYGIFALIEAVQQLRGEAGARQVKGAKTAIAHGNGGTLSSQSTAILGIDC